VYVGIASLLLKVTLNVTRALRLPRRLCWRRSNSSREAQSFLCELLSKLTILFGEGEKGLANPWLA
jgi:hypothetical protein